MSIISQEECGSRSRQILVVDDDPCVLESMVELLREEGYEANGARSGLQALQMIASKCIQPTLLLLDYHIGDTNGLELFDRLSEGEKPLAIMISGDLPESELARRGIPGMAKPCDVDQLLVLIDQTMCSIVKHEVRV